MDASMVQSLINSDSDIDSEVKERMQNSKEANSEYQTEMAFTEEKELETHKKANAIFSGEVVEIKDGYAKVRLVPNEDMVVDDYNLINQGFIFSAAHLAASASINNPKAIIINSHCKFLAPIELGNVLEFEAVAKRKDMKKSDVKVIGKMLGIKVFESDFSSIKLDRHPLKIKISR